MLLETEIVSNKLIFSSMEKLDGEMTDYIWNVSGDINIDFIAQALGAIFALIIVAKIAYKSILLKEGIDILGVMRPITFAFILANWVVITGALYAIVKPIQYGFSIDYENECKEITKLKEKRAKEELKIQYRLNEIQAQAEISKNGEKEVQEDEDKENEGEQASGISKKISDYYGDIYYSNSEGEDAQLNIMQTGSLISQSNTNHWIEDTILYLGEIYWEVSCYFIFLLKNIYLAVLVWFGPITFACSILPVWKDEWSSWIGRFISVSLYGAMAYLVMIISMQLIKYGLSADIETFKSLSSDEKGIFSYMADSTGYISLYLVALFVGAMALKLVPQLSTWAIPSDAARGAGDFINGMTHITNKVTVETAKKAAKAALAVATAGAAAASTAAGTSATASSTTASGTAGTTSTTSGNINTGMGTNSQAADEMKDNILDNKNATDNQVTSLKEGYENEILNDFFNNHIMSQLDELEEALRKGNATQIMKDKLFKHRDLKTYLKDGWYEKNTNENKRKEILEYMLDEFKAALVSGNGKQYRNEQIKDTDKDISNLLNEYERAIRQGKGEEFIKNLDERINKIR